MIEETELVVPYRKKERKGLVGRDNGGLFLRAVDGPLPSHVAWLYIPKQEVHLVVSIPS